MGFEGDLLVGAVGQEALDVVAGEGGDSELAVLDDVDEFVEEQADRHGMAGDDEVAEGDGGGEGEVGVAEAEFADEAGEGRLGYRQGVALVDADCVEDGFREVGGEGEFLCVGDGGGAFDEAAMVAGDVAGDGDGDEMGEHRFCDLAEGCLPLGGVARQGAISWVMFRVFGRVSRGDGGYFGSRREESQGEMCVFSTTLGLFPTFWALGGRFRPTSGCFPFGEVAEFVPPAPGGESQKGLFRWMQNKPSLFHYTKLSRSGWPVIDLTC